MSAFEFVFSLFGLLLGFSLVEVLGGLGKVLKSRRHIRVGWLTPLLALFVMVDITSFWMVAWIAREAIPANAVSFFTGLFICGLYYLAAILIARTTRPNAASSIATSSSRRPRCWLACLRAMSLPTVQGRGRRVDSETTRFGTGLF